MNSGEPDVLHGLDRDLARARERAARAVDRAEALSELLTIADSVAATHNSVTLTADRLADSLTDERERAHLAALTTRAYGPPPKEET